MTVCIKCNSNVCVSHTLADGFDINSCCRHNGGKAVAHIVQSQLQPSFMNDLGKYVSNSTRVEGATIGALAYNLGAKLKDGDKRNH